MLNRYGFVIAILLFGCLLMAVGYSIGGRQIPAGAGNIAATEDNSAAVEDLARGVEAGGAQQSADANSGTAGDGSGADSQASQDAAQEEPPLFDALQLTTVADEAQRYTLLLARYADESNLARYSNELSQNNIPVSPLKVMGANRQLWWLLISGDYDFAEAKAAAYNLKALYDVDSSLLKLPPPPPG